MKQVYHFLMILFIICFTTNLYSQSVPSYVPTNGLVGWWGFNGNAQDSSGKGNHETVNGATLATDRFENQNFEPAQRQAASIGMEESYVISTANVVNRSPIFQTEAINIWTENFSSDPNSRGWMNYGFRGINSGNTPDTNGVWEYRGTSTLPASGTGSRGAYSAGTTAIQSPTRVNGFMIFDSDWLDNNGSQIGAGVLGAPHRGMLISPSIDLSSHDFVNLSFYQYYRRFGGPGGAQSASATYLLFSVDDGATWSDTLTLNSNIAVNTSTSSSTMTRINVSPYIGGQDSVKIAFLFNGDYYFWMVDDIAIEQAPRVDMAITNTAFLPDTSAGRGIEYGMVPNSNKTPLTFQARVANIGSTVRNNVQLLVSVIDTTAPGTTLFTGTSAVLPSLNPFTDTVLSISTTYTPNVLKFTRVNYSLTFDSTTMDSTANNTASRQFELTDSVLALNVSFPASQLSFGTRNFIGNPPVFDIKIANICQLVSSDTVTSATARLVNTGTSTSQAGGLMYFTLETGDANTGLPGGTASVVLESDVYTLTASDISMGRVTVPFPATLGGIPQERIVNPGVYWLVAHLFSNNGSSHINLIDDQTVTMPWFASVLFRSTHWFNSGNAVRMSLNFGRVPTFYSGVSIAQNSSCTNDTTELAVTHQALSGIANAALRLTYNADSLNFLGISNLNPAWNGLVVNAGNGVITIDWNSSTNQNIPAGSMLKLRFKVNGTSNLIWDTLVIPCEFSDQNFNIIPQTFYNGSVTNRTVRSNFQRQICQGQILQMGGQTFSTGGSYQVVLPGSANACDTMVNLTLTVWPTQASISANICSNQPYNFGGRNLNVSGVYRDTLINALGCDSIVTLTLTVNPSYQNSISVVQCAGTPYSFGGQFLNTSGTYNQTFTSMAGCDSVVQLNLIVSDSLLIYSEGGVNGFCPGGTLRLGTSVVFSSGTFRWKFNGAVMGSASSDTFLASQAGSYQLEVILSPTCTLTSNTLTISVLNCNELTGDLRYDNAGLTPLAGVPIQLKTLLGNVVATDTTDSSGAYRMVGYSNGNYILDAEINYNWGGTNSTDALLVNRYFTSLVSLTPLRARAGDVNGNQITNSVDALLISRRITNLVLSFPVGSFVTARPTITAQGSPVFMTLRALSTGDVNGSYSIQPSAPTLVLDTVYENGNVGTAVVRFTNPGSGVFERGIVWSSSPNPTISSNKSVAGKGGYGFTHSFGGLTVGSLYYVRAYALTSVGVFYSPERSFTSIPGFQCPGTPSVTDVDGNLYHSVQIGTQCWTQSNLKVSKYRNGDNIPTGLSNTAWQNTTAGAYAIHDNNSVNDVLYGKLYNHHAVVDTRGLCPTGWHVPTDVEWTTLETFLGGSSVAGGALKSTAIQPTPGGWNSPNAGATNSSGFSAGPGGLRYFNGAFTAVGLTGCWWSSSLSGLDAWYCFLTANYGNMHRLTNDRTLGFSVRCLKDIVPSVSTTTVSNVTATSVTTGGDVAQDGGSPVTALGVAYGTSSSPTTSGTITNDGTGTGVFTSTLTGLTPSTTYYVRAYATNSVGTAYGNEVTFTTSPLSIGMSYAGGIVFDLDSSGQHGLVCAPSDQGAYEWGCFGTNIPNTSTAVGSGATNTASIMAGCGQLTIAAFVCADLVLNGYSDWYLPSSGELQLMYNRLHLQGLGGFVGGSYWSSSQYNPYYAWYMGFGGGDVFYRNKADGIQVRAVRAF